MHTTTTTTCLCLVLCALAGLVGAEDESPPLAATPNPLEREEALARYYTDTVIRSKATDDVQVNRHRQTGRQTAFVVVFRWQRKTYKRSWLQLKIRKELSKKLCRPYFEPVGLNEVTRGG